MTLDEQITHAAARVAVAWSNMDEQQAVEWEAEVDRLMDLRDWVQMNVQRIEVSAEEFAKIEALLDEEPRPVPRLRALVERVQARADFDVLKGHPDHSGMSRLADSIARLEARDA
jgi:hypothetical protein